jgi:hypothetical protein
VKNIIGDSAGDDDSCNDHWRSIAQQLVASFAGWIEGMADPKGNKVAATDGAGIHTKNAINVALEDLIVEDRKMVERELKEEMAELRRRKLACFQKMRGGIIKKSDTAAASNVKVNSQLNPEDFVHMIDISVTSKYGADLTQFTHVIAEDMHNTLDTFKKDFNSNLYNRSTVRFRVSVSRGLL